MLCMLCIWLYLVTLSVDCYTSIIAFTSLLLLGKFGFAEYCLGNVLLLLLAGVCYTQNWDPNNIHYSKF